MLQFRYTGKGKEHLKPRVNQSFQKQSDRPHGKNAIALLTTS